jgi:hypothetical protein
MNFRKLLFPLVFLLLISLVSAVNVCCEKTKSNEYCLYTDEANCAADSKMASITCEQTSYCKVGCCYSSDEGRCYKNVPKAECDSLRNSTWDPDGNCDIQQCKKGCCMIGYEAFFVTPVRCKSETSLYPNVTMTFDESVVTEQECIAKSRAQDEGCCVSGAECKFTTRSACSSASAVQTGNTTSDGFYSGMMCSNDKLKCGCAKQQKTGCIAGKDEVYWFDSCDNRENIYNADKVASYNNGYVLSKDQSCKLKGANDLSCGNCDYADGNLCGANPKGITMKFGEYTCRDVNCDSVYKDSVSPNSGSSKKNGESWCIFDTYPGHARDAVGSRHFRHICINGEELVEPCRDYREEICIQGIMNNDPAETAYDAFYLTGDYVESACRDNRWEDCYACNSVKNCGGDCAGKGAECCAKKCCEDIAVRDCYWMKSGIAVGTTGVCVPDVPPGFEFWAASVESPSSTTKSGSKTASKSTATSTTNTPSTVATSTIASSGTGAAVSIVEETTSTLASTATTGAAVSTATGTSTTKDTKSGGSGSAICTQANQECEVSWNRGGVSRLLGSESAWKCTRNCHCTEHTWIVAGNNLCKAMGDCGAKFNIIGKFTKDGYTNSAAAETKWFKGTKLTDAEVGDWKALSKPALGKKEDESSGIFGGKFSEFFSKAGLPLAVMVGQGIFTGYQTGWTKGAFTGGMTGGLSTIGNSVGWLFTLGKGASPIANWGVTYGTTTIASGASAKGAEVAASELSKVGVKDATLALKDGTIQGVGTAKDGLYQSYKVVGDLNVQSGQTVTAQTGMGNIMGALNTIMWIYTIYQLVDIFLAQDKTQTYTMACSNWVAPDGGKDCEKCNEDNENKPCSEYRCKSLGKLCSVINAGTSEEKCVNMHPNDANSPVISPYKDVISRNFTITEITAEGNKGFKVNEKLKPFQTITLGIETDEPSQCKFGSEHSVDYDQIVSYFGDQFFKYEHEITFSLPAEVTTPEALKLTNGGTYNIYIRCKDATGNKNNRDYFIRFSISPSPDMTAPVIERTSVESGAFAPAGVNETYFSIFTNEPAECRWNLNDTEFSMMDNKFTCAESGFSLSSVYYGLYECKTTLTLKDSGSTDYYFRCKDKKGNFNTESYLFSLMSTKSLNITGISPSGTLYESDVNLMVTTIGGSSSGNARCGYSTSDVPFLSMIEFYETNSTTHKQPLVLDKGDYKYYITCRDIAGNEAYSNITFKVDIDLDAPRIVYVYSEGTVLHLEMSEITNCEYSTNSTISYGSGTAMTGTDSIAHELSIVDSAYYISCVDIYKNEAKFTVYV